MARPANDQNQQQHKDEVLRKLREKSEEFTQEHDTSHLSPEEQKKMHEAYSKMGQVGGETVRDKYGKEFYETIGEMGGSKRKEDMAHSGEYKKK